MGGVRIPIDLDPADARSRAQLIDELRAARESQQMGLKEIAEQLDVTSPSVFGIEHRTTWQARTLTRYARAVGRRVEWLLHDLPVPDDDVMSYVLAGADTSTPERADQVAWRLLCHDLVRTRRAMCSAVEMARRTGIHQNGVHHWEENPDGSSVIAAQRHARALGGRLGWRLHRTTNAVVGE